MSVKKDGTEIVGATPDEKGTLICDKCGSQKIKGVMFLDGDDWYSNTYECTECGSGISVSGKREYPW